MNNITIRFSNDEETSKMIDFLQENSHLLKAFKNDNNDLSGTFHVSFTNALPHQVGYEHRKKFINMRMPEIAPYVWRLACWMSFRSTYRENLDPILYLNDEKFNLVIHPSGRGNEIRIEPNGMPVETGISAIWKVMHRNKEHNEDVLSKIVEAWKTFK